MIETAPLAADRWDDLERLFGPRGACAGCWCMWWRQTGREFEQRKGDANRDAFAALVAGGTEPGLLAYDGGEPVGWCAVQPRAAYPSLNRSVVALPDPPADAWAVPCLFVASGHRRRGISVHLLRSAAEHAAARGARTLEGYPVEPRQQMPAAFAWTGTVAAFRDAGFVEVARRRPTRPVMRRQFVPASNPPVGSEVGGGG